MKSENELPEIVIPKDKAVFWMDRFGRWHNDGGPFEHKKIIDYFNASIRRDEAGYFVVQTREAVREKVYFRYEDTPLFAVDMRGNDAIELILNTREVMPLSPRDLFVSKDTLYMRRGDERVRFTDRAMLKLSGHLDEADGRYWYVEGDHRLLLPEE